jgi:hypothetical protein
MFEPEDAVAFNVYTIPMYIVHFSDNLLGCLFDIGKNLEN